MPDFNVHKFVVTAIVGTAVICLTILGVHWFGLVRFLATLLGIGALALLAAYRAQVLRFLRRVWSGCAAQLARWRKQRTERQKARREREQIAVTSLEISHFHTKVAGVTHENDDGSDRQRIVKRCRIGEELLLEHDSQNRYDPTATRVCRVNGQQIGFLSSELAAQLVEHSERGRRYSAFISDLTGGTRSKPIRGVNMLIIESGPGVRPHDVRKYLKTIR